MSESKGMYDTVCEYCGKPMKAFAKNRRGDLPTVYCSTPCKKNAEYEKRFRK